MSNQGKPKVTRGTIETAKRLLGYVTSTYKVQFILVLICILISSVASISVSLSLRFLLDDFIIPLIGKKNPDYSDLYMALTVLACIFMAGVLASFLYTRLMVVIGQGVLKRVRDEMFEHMQKLPIRYFDQNTNGSIMSLYTNDTDTLRQMINQSIPQVLMSAFTIVVTFIAMVALSPILTLLAVLVIGVMIVVAKFIGGNSGKYFIRQQLDLANITGFVEERMNGQRVVKVFNHERKSEQEFDVLNEKLYESAANAHTFASIMGPVIGNIGNLQFVLTAVLGGFLSVMGIGNITLGVMASYLQFTKSFTQPFMQVAQQFNAIVMALAGAERIFALMDEEPEKDEGYVTLVNARRDENGEIVECRERTGMWAWKHPHQADGTVTYTELKGDVRFYDMSFGYEPDHMVLHDLTLYAKPGQKLAFVGSTGAGKTTITNLINRFYDVQDGKIRYDGININKIKKADLRHSLGIVLQDTHLFTGTIMENIRYGKLDATDEEVYSAAKLAHADQFIKMLPNGYDTMLTGDGEELSQGQRQLLAIARAAIADPPVLILDEATSSIDTRTESIVQQGMDNLMKGRTVFVIAHRLSTIRNSDAIMVLEHGRIIERGDHEDLIAQKGTYYYSLNHPMAFATELTRIRIRNTGVIHLIMTVNSFSPTNLPLLLRTSSEIVFGPTKKPTKMQVKKATIGIMTLLLMKSMISRMVMPAQVMKESGPNPREDGIPITRARTATKMQADFRLQWNLSRKMDTMVSIREMEEVSAAKMTSRKKAAPTAFPNCMLSNTFGSMTNIRLGPLCRILGSPPEKTKTAGITIRPARKAIAVSKISICRTELSRFVSFRI